MKVLLDACVWGGVVKPLQDAGHDVVWAGDWPEDPGDEEILTRAAAKGCVLVTLDKDFGELAVVRGMRHCGIVRLVNIPARLQSPTCQRILARHRLELESGAILTAEPGRLRIRPHDQGR